MKSTENLNVEVLGAGYAYHTKFVSINQKEGIPYYLFRLQTEGHSKALVNHHLIDIYPGDLLLYRPGDAYELLIEPSTTGATGTPSGSGDYYLFCKGTWMDQWWSETKKNQKSHIPVEDGILSLWRHLVLERRRVKDDVQEISDYLVRALCLMVDRALKDSEVQTSAGNRGSSITAYQMKNYIEQNATSEFTLDHVAKHIGLSVSRAVHLFKATFNQTIMEYAIEIRLSIACERILFSSLTLEQAAEAAGFNSYSYFHRAFKSRYGTSPRQFRTDHQSLYQTSF